MPIDTTGSPAARLIRLALPAVATGAACLALTLPAWLSSLLTGLAAFVPVASVILRNTTIPASDSGEKGAWLLAQRIIDQIPHPIYVKDAQGRYRLVNRAFGEELGRDAAQILGHTAFDLAPSDAHAERSHHEDTEALAGKFLRREQHDVDPVHGGERHRLITKGGTSDHHEQPIVVGGHFDTSRWWIMEAELQEALQREQARHRDTRQFVQRIIDQIPYPVYVKDDTSRFTMVNRAMADDTGIAAEALIGDMGLGTQIDAETMRSMFEEDGAVLAGEVVFKEEHGHRKHTDRAGSAEDKEYFRLTSKGSCLDTQEQTVIVGTHIDLTELRSAERELKQSLEREVELRERTESFIQRLIDVIPDPVYIKRRGGQYVMVNAAFANYHGRSKEDFINPAIIPPVSRPETRALSLSEDDAVLAGSEVLKEEHTTRKATGDEVFRIVCKRRSVFVNGEPVIVGIDHHITKWRVAERELNAVLEREVAQRLRTERFVQDLIDVIPDPVYIKSAAGQYLIINDAFARLRQQPKHELVGCSARDLAPNQETAEISEIEDRQVITGAEILKEEHASLPITGDECFRIVCKRRCIDVDGEAVVVGIDHYITEWRLAERELKRLAEEDSLTGIANRRHFSREAMRAINQATRYKEPLGILMVDVDHFKHINDQYGHNIGDEVLIEVVARLREGLRNSDLPGRWGGEEFIVLLPHTPRQEAQQVAERLRRAVADKSFLTSAGPIRISFSGGVAQLVAGETLEQLVGRADEALYAAKHGGRNQIVVSKVTA